MSKLCSINKNLDKTGCDYSLPQIVDIYLANYADVKEATVDETGEVSAFVMNGQGKWYHIEPNKNSASWGDRLAVGDSGNKYKIHSVSFSYSNKYDAGMVDTMDALALGRFLAVLIMADGSAVLLGNKVGLEASENDNVTNTGSGDATAEGGLSVTLSANCVASALPLAKTAIEAVSGTVVEEGE
jgi:hypothetical protein